ncbi:ubiquitin-protein ligase [Lithospermum erythrorhizon]|uniref:Ubiquitin-protein ligase n=1 Tax=Lithospermum erythrorhizon TaxID=34254 RepID=A0AAV3RL01_LITER
MSGTSNPTTVYHRRKQHSNFVGKISVNTRISDGYHSIISSEANSVTTKDHTTSEVVHERKVNNVLPHKVLHHEETVRTDKQEHQDTCCLNDSCSSSKSNLDLDTVRMKTDADDLGECSSSGDLPAERLCDTISERSISVDCASAQGTDVISDNCFRRSCKMSKRPEYISRMVSCDSCKDTFDLPCCNSHFKEMLEIDNICGSCMKTKETPRDKSPGRVDDVSPLLSLGNACKESTSEDESHLNTSGKATSEDESHGNTSGKATSEDECQGIASPESSSEDEFDLTISRNSRSEEPDGNASRQATPEGETLGNIRTDSASEDELEHTSDTDTTSGDGMGPLILMLKDKKPFTSKVRIGSQFQTDVPEWSGPVIDESCSIAGEPLEISVVENLHDSNCKRPLMMCSIGNWLQCREIVVRAREGVEEIICGKWRRAPLFEVQTDQFECFDCILWDPYHADCAVEQAG